LRIDPLRLTILDKQKGALRTTDASEELLTKCRARHLTPTKPSILGCGLEINGDSIVRRKQDHPTTQEWFKSISVSADDFAAAAQECSPRIFRFLLASFRDADVAADLTRECFLRAYRSKSRFQRDSNLGIWLLQIAIKLQKDSWRNRRLRLWRCRRFNSGDADEVRAWVSIDKKSAEEQLIACAQVASVWRAVDGMRERPRTIFLLHAVEELEAAEISVVTGLSEGVVKLHLTRALRAVRAQLAQP
jgi:RNA polymerase sigma-70 factor, ECF subfamily